MTTIPRRVSLKEMAEALNLSVVHTRRLIAAGKIPAPDRIGSRKYSWPAHVLVELATSTKGQAA